MNIGILGFQGAIIEHRKAMEELGCEVTIVLYPEDLDKIDGIILPGGESTTMSKLLTRTGMREPLTNKIKEGLPVWGTCAGLILLAKELVNCDKVNSLKLMDISVKRNAYGTQINSFNTNVVIEEVSKNEIPLVFIRAPYITSTSNNVHVICEIDGNIVAAKQDKMLATSFHPELTDNLEFHKYFMEMCR